jgi:hypothetical protein
LLAELQSCRQHVKDAEANHLAQANELQVQLLTAHKLLIAWRLQHPLHANFKKDNIETERTIAKLQRGVQPLLQSWQQQELQQLRRLVLSSSQDSEDDNSDIQLDDDNDNLHDERSAENNLREDLEADLSRVGEQLVDAQEIILELRHENGVLQLQHRMSEDSKRTAPHRGPPRQEQHVETTPTPARRVAAKEENSNGGAGTPQRGTPQQQRGTPQQQTPQRGWNDNTHIERRKEAPKSTSQQGWNDNTHVERRQKEAPRSARSRISQRHKRLLGGE